MYIVRMYVVMHVDLRKQQSVSDKHTKHTHARGTHIHTYTQHIHTLSLIRPTLTSEMGAGIKCTLKKQQSVSETHTQINEHSFSFLEDHNQWLPVFKMYDNQWLPVIKMYT